MSAEGFEAHLASLEPLLQRYGIGAVFLSILVEGFGVPAPGQSLLIAGALLAGRGELRLPLLLAAAALAAALGNAIGFEIGRRGGRPLLERFAGGGRLARVERLFQRSGGALVAFGRFVDGLRQVNGLAAGAFGMERRRFLVWNAAGAVVWAGVWGIGAYVLGRDLHDVASRFHRARPVLLVLVAAVALVLLVWLRRGR